MGRRSCSRWRTGITERRRLAQLFQELPVIHVRTPHFCQRCAGRARLRLGEQEGPAGRPGFLQGRKRRQKARFGCSLSCQRDRPRTRAHASPQNMRASAP